MVNVNTYFWWKSHNIKIFNLLFTHALIKMFNLLFTHAKLPACFPMYSHFSHAPLIQVMTTGITHCLFNKSNSIVVQGTLLSLPSKSFER